MLIMYAIAAGLSITIAILLVRISKISGQGRAVLDRKKEIVPRHLDISSDGSIKEIIYREAGESIKSESERLEISERISNIFEKELEEKIRSRELELGKKYDNILDGKSKSEEIAWKKYKKVVGDKKRTETVIHSIAEGVIVVDAKGKVLMINPAAERLLDIRSTEKVGKSILDNLKKEHMVSLSKESELASREIEVVSRDEDTKKVLRASSAVVENEFGETVGMVSVLSDITKQKKLDSLKADFIANVSHELRTPIIAVEKSISLVLNGTAGQISEAQEKLLSIAVRNLKRLTLIINDLLDLSKIEAAKMKIVGEMASIGRVINESVDSLASWIKTKSIKAEIDIEEGLPDVYIDRNKMIQILNNLIGNAIKFTPVEGLIIVRASLNSDGNNIEVSVKDNGIGIAEEDLLKIFDKFYQSGDRVPTDISGTGIGLSIAKEMVALHGGKIWIKSEKGNGAEFIFTLPLKRQKKT